MTIHLPANLESSILDAVHSGRYASVDDAMAAAASMLLERLQLEKAQRSADQRSRSGFRSQAGLGGNSGDDRRCPRRRMGQASH